MVEMHKGVISRMPSSARTGLVYYSQTMSEYSFVESDLNDDMDKYTVGKRVTFLIDRRGFATNIKP